MYSTPMVTKRKKKSPPRTIGERSREWRSNRTAVAKWGNNLCYAGTHRPDQRVTRAALLARVVSANWACFCRFRSEMPRFWEHGLRLVPMSVLLRLYYSCNCVSLTWASLEVLAHRNTRVLRGIGQFVKSV